MVRSAFKIPVLIMAAFLVVHGLLEAGVLRRGWMTPSGGEWLEAVLTFPLACGAWLFGPRTPLGCVTYYLLVVANAFLLGSVIRTLFLPSSESSTHDAGEDAK